MAFHRCAIHGADGAVVATDITVNLEETPAGWHATISASHLMPIVAGEQYRLVLDDGRSGSFRVRRNTFAGGADRAIACDGMGELR
jgi:hypothetical protein